MTDLIWQRSRRCDGGTCVEVAGDGDAVLVRDGKDPSGSLLRFTRTEWMALMDIDGEFVTPDRRS